jgi:hypothetical protein
MRINEQITNIITKSIHIFIQDRGAYKHNNARIVFHLYFFRNKYIRQPSNVFRWRSLQGTLMTLTHMVTDLFYDFVNILLVKLLNSKCNQIGKYQ